MRFQYVATMLDLAFDAASSGKNNWDTPTLNAIAAIWSEMCADAVLCNKLLERGWSYSRLSEVRWLRLIRMILVGAATRIMKLLPTSISSTVTVRLLALISYHGNEATKLEVAEVSGFIVHIMHTQSASDAAYEWGLAALAHSIEGAILAGYTGSKCIVWDSAVDDLVDICIKALRRPSLTHNMARHVLSLLTMMHHLSRHATSNKVVCPPGIFVAMTRSEDMGIRAHGLTTLRTLCSRQLSGNEGRILHPSYQSPCLTPDILPPYLWKSIEDFGNDSECETSLRRRAEEKLVQLYHEFSDILTQPDSEGRLIQLGAELGLIVPYFDLLCGARKRLATEFGFVDSTVSLAILAIRHSGDSSVQHLADNLRLYHISQTSSAREIWDAAQEVIAGDPTNIYAYAVGASQMPSVASCREHFESAMRGAEIARTLDLADTYLFRKLLLAVMKCLFFYGTIDLLKERPENQFAREHAHLSLEDVLSTTEEYLEAAPPDALDLPCVLEARMISMIFIQGSEFSLDLRELKVRCVARPRQEPMLTA